MDIQMTRKQKAFCDATATEVLYGGAAGGGKTYSQIIDAFLCAIKYPGSKQLVLRRTYPELDKSIIRTTMEIYPKELFSYNSANHVGKFVNGSIIDYGYCDNERDVYKYQSAEYDYIRFDEATHFTGEMYLYLMSRLRGANNYPKQIKSSTNPGGVGHQFFKSRFIDNHASNDMFYGENGTRIFIPARVDDNKFLLNYDPDYKNRLLNLSEKDKKALLFGEWDIFDGQYFSMFDRRIHVIKPIDVLQYRKFVSFDYGRDMFACLFFAVDTKGKAYAYKEIYKSDLLVSEAAKLLKTVQGNDIISCYYAPPDLWNKHSDSGRSTAEIFASEGIYLTKANNNRIQGWYDVAEWLKPFKDEQGFEKAQLQIFDNCLNLIRCLPAIQYDSRNPNDCSTEPHELTHICDALRYFIAGRPLPARQPSKKQVFNFSVENPITSNIRGGTRDII